MNNQIYKQSTAEHNRLRQTVMTVAVVQWWSSVVATQCLQYADLNTGHATPGTLDNLAFTSHFAGLGGWTS